VSSLSLLDVAIAMVFFFLLLSLVCSAANEIFAALLQQRARFLERGIKRLLLTDDFTAILYDHPLIQGLADEVDPGFKWLHKALPSYIPSRTFALAILDILQQHAVTPVAAATSASGVTLQPPAVPAPTLPVIPAGVRRALDTVMNEAARDAISIRQSIEDWYNTAMDRVSGTYKRRTQYVLFAFGMIAAILVNADSVVVIERLAANKALSAAVTAAADVYQRNTSTSQSSTDPEKSLAATLTTLDKLELPIGWNGLGNVKAFTFDITQPVKTAILFGDQVKIHWIGWLITALAVSFGAPFWFDVLGRFMTVRSTIKPQDKS
jgi:hypothetical protein